MVPSHAEMEGNWIEGITVPQHCLIATCHTHDCTPKLLWWV